MPVPEPLEVRPVHWPEVRPGDDLASLIHATTDLRNGDVIVVTSKVVAKAEGRVVRMDRAAAVAGETEHVVARRGTTVIARTRHGFVLAAAGVDASNTEPGTAVLLPLDPDASARRLRERLAADPAVNVAVVVTDTAGRAWRTGQTDLAVGCAGLDPQEDLHGSRDPYGNLLVVTAAAVADEIAGAADLVCGKTSGCPLAVIRGLESRVLPAGRHGPGARSLVRPASDDLFGLGARDAVAAAAVRSDPDALARFARRAPDDGSPFDGLIDGWRAATGEHRPAGGPGERVRADLTTGWCPDAPAPVVWTLRVAVPAAADPIQLVDAGRLLERADALAAAHRLRRHDHHDAVDAIEPEDRSLVVRCWWDG